MKKFILFIILILCTKNYAQQKTADSLYHKLNKIQSDTEKVNVLSSIQVFYSNNNNDSALKFAQAALSLADKINFTVGKIKALGNLGTVYYYKSKNAYALNYYLQSIKLTQALEKKEGSTSFTKKQLSRCYNNIGTIFHAQKKYSQAQNYYKKAILIDLLSNDKPAAAQCYNNIGVIRQTMGYYAEAIKNYQQALDIKMQLGDSISIPSTLINIGTIKMTENKYGEASFYFIKALDYCKNTNNLQDKALALINLGDLYYSKKEYAASLPYYKEGIDICKQQNNSEFLSYAYQSISLPYFKLKNFEKAYEFFQLHITIKDSIYNKDNYKTLNEMQIKYDTENKEKEINLLTKDKELQNIQLKNNKIIIYSTLIGLIIIIGFAIYVFYAFKQKQKVNLELDFKNKKIEFAYKIIDEKQKEVLDSINYAKRIQYALLANTDFIKKYIPNNFILFNPKDIVSGDFYWATNITSNNHDLFFLACCDSTGHGVPGAFMSLLSIGFLSEAINEKNIHTPNQIFDYVRQRLINSIGSDNQKDGFDGILVCIDSNPLKKEVDITYAASNNAPILITTNNSINQLIELPKDKMPVGQGEKNTPFTLFTINAKAGDTLYLYTDGYADQFGGPKAKKFKRNALNQLLLQISNTTVNEQFEVLNQQLKDWKGDLEQVDDVCVIGIKL